MVQLAGILKSWNGRASPSPQLARRLFYSHINLLPELNPIAMMKKDGMWTSVLSQKGPRPAAVVLVTFSAAQRTIDKGRAPRK